MLRKLLRALGFQVYDDYVHAMYYQGNEYKCSCCGKSKVEWRRG